MLYIFPIPNKRLVNLIFAVVCLISIHGLSVARCYGKRNGGKRTGRFETIKNWFRLAVVCTRATVYCT